MAKPINIVPHTTIELNIRDKVRADKEAIKREVDERKQYERLRKKFTGQ